MATSWTSTATFRKDRTFAPRHVGPTVGPGDAGVGIRRTHIRINTGAVRSMIATSSRSQFALSARIRTPVRLRAGARSRGRDDGAGRRRPHRRAPRRSTPPGSLRAPPPCEFRVMVRQSDSVRAWGSRPVKRRGDLEVDGGAAALRDLSCRAERSGGIGLVGPKALVKRRSSDFAGVEIRAGPGQRGRSVTVGYRARGGRLRRLLRLAEALAGFAGCGRSSARWTTWRGR